MKYLLLLATSFLVAYSQIVLKWQVNVLVLSSHEGEAGGQWLPYMARLLQSPWVWTAISATFLAGIAWMLALSKFDLGAAYPVVLGLTFVLVLVASAALLQEQFSAYRVAGVACTAVGIALLLR